MKDLKPGQVSKPLELQGSIYLFQVGAWLKDPEDQNEELLERARQELESIRRREAVESLVQSLRDRTGSRSATRPTWAGAATTTDWAWPWIPAAGPT